MRRASFKLLTRDILTGPVEGSRQLYAFHR